VILPALERKIQNQLRRAARGAKAKHREDDDTDEGDDVRPRTKRPCDPFSSRTPCK
jgi:hypothetical protein